MFSSGGASRRSKRAGAHALLEDRAHQREAVAVDAVRGDPDQHVADADRGAVDHASRARPRRRRSRPARARPSRTCRASSPSRRRAARSPRAGSPRRRRAAPRRRSRCRARPSRGSRGRRGARRPARSGRSRPSRRSRCRRCRSGASCAASLSFVPTPSALATSTGSLVAVGRLEEARRSRRSTRAPRAGRWSCAISLIVVDEALVVVEIDAGAGVRRCARLGRLRAAGDHAAWIGDPGRPVNPRDGAMLSFGPVQIAVVIPALDEADRVAARPWQSARAAGGRDRRRRRGQPRRDAGARPGGRRPGGRLASRGRARQLAAGVRATAARGARLPARRHAGCPPGFADAVRGALADPRWRAAPSRLRFEREPGAGRLAAPRPAHRRAGRGAARGALRASLRRPGALRPAQRARARPAACPRSPILEDLDLVAALRRTGRFVAAAGARRRPRRGAISRGASLRTWLRNAGALAAWRLGVDRARVAALVPALSAAAAPARGRERGREPARDVPDASAATCAATGGSTPSASRRRSATRPPSSRCRCSSAGWCRRSATGSASAEIGRRCAWLAGGDAGARRAALPLAHGDLQRGARGRVRDAQRPVRAPPAPAPVVLLPLAHRRPDEPLRERPRRRCGCCSAPGCSR